MEIHNDTKFIATIVGIVCLTIVAYIAKSSNLETAMLKDVFSNISWAIVGMGGGYGFLQTKFDNKKTTQ